VGAFCAHFYFSLGKLISLEVKTISKVIEKKVDVPVNEQIQATTVLVIGEDGQQLGEKDLQTAINMAEERGLDLVCVAQNAKPPVCKFMDYKKYRFDMQKRAREAKKAQSVVVVKEIVLSPVIGDNDFETKLRNGIKFLEEGNKLKVTLAFNRRARMINNDPTFAVLTKYLEAISDIAVVEHAPQLEGKRASAIVAPKKKK
jgi:translation initiation factor IF-3